MKIDLRFGDTITQMDLLPDKCIDLILCDLPYQSTNCSWDKHIPLNEYVIVNGKCLYKDQYYLDCFYKGLQKKQIDFLWNLNKNPGLWDQYERIIKDNGAILLTSQTPFDKILAHSNLKLLRYEWIWEKTQATGHLNAKKMPMKAHENVLVFYKKEPTYNPIMTEGHIRKVSKAKNRAACIERRNNTDNIYNNEYADKVNDYDSTTRYPRSVLQFKTDKQTSNLHKTQKPVALMEYFIKTYSNENDLVLDNTMGSCSTGIACINTNRNFIGIDNNKKYFDISVIRCKEAIKYNDKDIILNIL